MNISISSVMAVGVWVAFLSVMAIVGIIIAGGFVVALIGKLVLNLFENTNEQETEVNTTNMYDIYNATNTANQEYRMQNEERVQTGLTVEPAPETSPADDYVYEEIDETKAKEEEEALNNEAIEEDDFFKDFNGEQDSRFEDDDLMSMVDEISQDILGNEEEEIATAEAQFAQENKSVLDNYSIDDFFKDEELQPEEVEETEVVDEQPEEVVEEPLGEVAGEQLEDVAEEQELVEEETPLVENVVDEQTMREVNELKQQVEEILGAMEENKNKNETFNEQLIKILNELTEANKKGDEVKTEEDAENEIVSLKRQLEDAKREIERQVNESMLRSELREQLSASNAEIESLKNQLSELQAKLNEDDGDQPVEVKPSAEAEQIASLKEELMGILASMREESKNTENAEIQDLKAQLSEMQAKLDASKVETEQDAPDQIALLRDDLREMISSINNPKDAEIENLKAQLSELQARLIVSDEDEQPVEDEEVQSVSEENDEISSLRDEVKEMLDAMREESNAKNEQFNTQLLEILNEMKSATLKQSEQVPVETAEEAVEEIDTWREDLENAQKELENRFKEELANKDDAHKAELQEQMENYNSEINGLKSQLADLMEAFKQSNEQSKAETQSLIDQLEAERRERIRVEQEKVNENNEQLDALRRENEELMRKLTKIRVEKYEPLTEEENDDLYADVPDDSRKLEEAKEEIEKLKAQVERMTTVMEGGEAEKLVQNDNVVEDERTLETIKELAQEAKESQVPVVRSPLFDVELIKTITAQEVEIKVQERLAEAMKEIEDMKAQLEISKKEVEKQYKEEIQKGEEMEVQLKAKLQESAAEIIALKEQLSDLTEQIEFEHQEARENSDAIVEQLEQDRKEKEEITKHQLQIEDANNNDDGNVTVVGPKNNQVALVTNSAVLTEGVDDYSEDIPTIDINTVKKLAEQEIEEKVEQRMTSSIIEIQELKKQILNLSIQIQEIKDEPADDEKPITLHYSTEQAYLERIAILEERLKVAKKDFKINAKELNPLEKVNRTLERDKIKLRRKEAIVAKKRIALYGVNEYVDIDKEKAEKLAQELELLDGLRYSVSHCEEVMNANIDRYPILVHTSKILKENIANIESDLEQLHKELDLFRANNGTSEN